MSAAAAAVVESNRGIFSAVGATDVSGSSAPLRGQAARRQEPCRLRRTLDSHSRRRPGPFSRGAVDPGLRRTRASPTLGAIAERLILGRVVDTDETTTSTTYSNLATNDPAAFHRNAYRKVQPPLLDEIDQADAANADGIADVGNPGQFDTPARLLSDDDTSTGTASATTNGSAPLRLSTARWSAVPRPRLPRSDRIIRDADLSGCDVR